MKLSIAQRILPWKSTRQLKEQSFLGVFKQELQPKKVESSSLEPQVYSTRRKIPQDVYERIMGRTKPRFVLGFWKKAELSRLELSHVKKRYILAGYDWPKKPYRDLSNYYENARSTFYHPDKIKRLEKIAANMEKMPGWIEEFQKKQEKDKLEEEKKSYRTESEIYQRAIHTDEENSPEWIQERVKEAQARKLKRASDKALKKKNKQEEFE